MTDEDGWNDEFPRTGRATSLPDITERRDDVPLVDAQLLWNDAVLLWSDGTSDEPAERSAPLVANHTSQPDADVAEYDNATGACFQHWRGKTDEGRLVELLRDAWMAIVRDGVDPAAMHEALLAVPEFRDVLHPAELPVCYQEAA